MGYKKYSDKASAEEMLEKIEDGEIPEYTAYRELIQIFKEWQGTDVGREAKDLLDDEYKDYGRTVSDD